MNLVVIPLDCINSSPFLSLEIILPGEFPKFSLGSSETQELFVNRWTLKFLW